MSDPQWDSDEIDSETEYRLYDAIYFKQDPVPESYKRPTPTFVDKVDRKIPVSSTPCLPACVKKEKARSEASPFTFYHGKVKVEKVITSPSHSSDSIFDVEVITDQSPDKSTQDSDHDAEPSSCDSDSDDFHFVTLPDKPTLNPAQLFCTICMKRGHTRYECEREGPVCILCGYEGHLSKNCKQLYCNMCNAAGHTLNKCPIKTELSQAQCKRCNVSGHTALLCPDQWRQYRHTEEPGPPVHFNYALPNRGCCNCGSRKHIAENCPNPPAQSLFRYYKNLPRRQVRVYDQKNIYAGLSKAAKALSGRPKSTPNFLNESSAGEWTTILEETIVEEKEKLPEQQPSSSKRKGKNKKKSQKKQKTETETLEERGKRIQAELVKVSHSTPKAIAPSNSSSSLMVEDAGFIKLSCDKNNFSASDTTLDRSFKEHFNFSAKAMTKTFLRSVLKQDSVVYSPYQGSKKPQNTRSPAKNKKAEAKMLRRAKHAANLIDKLSTKLDMKKKKKKNRRSTNEEEYHEIADVQVAQMSPSRKRIRIRSGCKRSDSSISQKLSRTTPIESWADDG